MLNKFLDRAKRGEPVFITDVRQGFEELDASIKGEMVLVLQRLDDAQQSFNLCIPCGSMDAEHVDFVKSYVHAEIYNILSSLGGKSMTVYLDKSNKLLVDIAEQLNEVFCINSSRKERLGYGRCINVIDRMIGACADAGASKGFSFFVESIEDLPTITNAVNRQSFDIDIIKKSAKELGGKMICGMDIGGTDIKIAMVNDGEISCFKEYDWFPASFTESSQLVEPICLLVRLLNLKMALEMDTTLDDSVKDALKKRMDTAMDKDATDDVMMEVVSAVEDKLGQNPILLDAIGLCFPDVVVKDKVVGGEVYKTRGIRNNPNIDYESDFLKLTHLNDRLHEYCKEDGVVKITNDGPMASFTAAVEMIAGGEEQSVLSGVYAHTLGTELGTGWLDDQGAIPEIPLEVYNFIIDLGSFDEKQHKPDDLRSINNFNTDLAGTLQKYTSQSGVFRLAMKYFPAKRPDLYQEMFDKGFVVEKVVDGVQGYFVPTELKDMRKPFLEHLMALPEREDDETCKRIFKEIGEFLAVTWLETERIMAPETKPRILFGRLVKNDYCFKLMCEGAKGRKSDLQFEVADGGMANTKLMKQLEGDRHFTVAQFAQAVGAVYYGNLGLLKM